MPNHVDNLQLQQQKNNIQNCLLYQVCDKNKKFLGKIKAKCKDDSYE